MVWINTSFEKLINLVVTLFLDPHTKKRGKEKIQKKKRKKIVRRKQKKINKKRILECQKMAKDWLRRIKTTKIKI